MTSDKRQEASDKRLATSDKGLVTSDKRGRHSPFSAVRTQSKDFERQDTPSLVASRLSLVASCRLSLVTCRCRQGTALVEAVLAIPMLAGMLLLTWWAGWMMNNQMRVRAAANYEAWRGAYGGEVESVEKMEFASRGTVRERLHTGGTSYTLETRNEFVEIAAGVSSQAAELADRGARQRFPAGSLVTMTADFPTTVGVWNSMQRSLGDLQGRAGREGVTWRRGEASMRTPVVEMYLPELETLMQGIPEPGDGMAEMVRGLYRWGW